jgi:putative transposase
LKLANIVDEHTREALAMRVGRSCTADDLVEILAGLVAARGAPEQLRMDNGPELLAWAVRDYCRLSGTRTTYIEPGAPWENPYVESFNGRVRDELLNLEEFTSMTVAQVVVEAWRIEYNTYRPTPPSAAFPPPNTQPTGPAPTNPHSHSEWTTDRGPITGLEALVMVGHACGYVDPCQPTRPRRAVGPRRTPLATTAPLPRRPTPPDPRPGLLRRGRVHGPHLDAMGAATRP